MKPESSTVLLIALLAVGGVLFGQAGAPPLTTASPAQVEPATTETLTTQKPSSGVGETGTPCYREVDRLLAEFFTANPQRGLPPNFFISEAGKKYSLEFLIATVYDPVDSQVGWRFDLMLDALQRAVEASRYVLDRYSLPWECASKPDKADPTKPLKRPHEEKPGVLLFRRGTDILVLFLIGETPTSGIQKPAFADALNSIKKYQGLTKPVRIMGPNSSGAVTSLKTAIEAWWQTNRQATEKLYFKIISGSATRFGNKEDLGNLSMLDGLDVKFFATVAPDTAALNVFIDYVSSRDSNVRIAVLRESNTSYGENIGQFKREGTPLLQLPYPMHISQLRSVYAKDPAFKAQLTQRQGNLTEAPRLSLELPLDEIGNPRDVLQAQNPLRTAAVVDRVLANILSTISREDIRYVGLFGTDTIDKLFLSRLIRRYCPDVRLFTLSSDLLYAHPDYASDLEGMIVVSTYPLFNKNQQWTYPFNEQGRRLQFPYQGAQGIYNATVALLGERELLEYATPFEAGKYSAEDSTKPRPPIWLTVVGHGGLWPLAVFPDYILKDYLFEAMRPPAISRPPRLMQSRLSFTSISFLVFSLFCLINCLAFWTATVRSARGESLDGLHPLRLFHPGDGSEHQREHFLWLAAYFLTLMIIAAVTGSFCLIPPVADLKFQGDIAWEGWLRIGWVMLILFFLMLTTLTALVKTIWPKSQLLPLRPKMTAGAQTKATDGPSKSRRSSLPLIILTVGSLLVSVSLLVLLITRVIPSRLVPLILLYERATNFASEVSPLLPFVLLGAGVCLWSVCHMKRVRLLDVVTASNPLTNCEGVAGRRFKELAERVERSLNRPFRPVSWLVLAPLMLAFLLLPWAVFYLRTSLTLEQGTMKWLLLIGLPLLNAGMILAFVQTLSVWYRFKPLLRGWAAHPLAEACDRLPTSTAKTLRSQFWARLPTADDDRRAKQHWQTLTKHFDEIKGSVAAQLNLPLEMTLPSEPDEAKLTELLDHFWATRSFNQPEQSGATAKPELCPPNKPTMELYTRAFVDPVQMWFRLAEDFIALRIAGYTSMILIHQRNLLTFVTAGALLMLLAITSYPFQPQRLLTIFLWTTILSVVAGSLLIFIQADRDEVLSRMAQTSPNRVTFDRTFITMVVTYGLLPLFGLLATQFPETWGLFSWVEPVLRAFK